MIAAAQSLGVPIQQAAARGPLMWREPPRSVAFDPLEDQPPPAGRVVPVGHPVFTYDDRDDAAALAPPSAQTYQPHVLDFSALYSTDPSQAGIIATAPAAELATAYLHKGDGGLGPPHAKIYEAQEAGCDLPVAVAVSAVWDGKQPLPTAPDI
jgi:hypothetical protein